MCKLVKLIMVFVSLMACTRAFSECELIYPTNKSICPYVGANIKVIHMDYKKGYGRNLLPHNIPQGSVYAGMKINKNLSIEAGYEHSVTRKRFSRLTQGDVSAGTPVISTLDPSYFISKITMKGPYVDAVRLYHISDNKATSLIVSSGISFIKVRAKRRGTCIANLFPGLDRGLKGDKLVLRFSTGLQHMITNNLGIRTTVGWMNTSRVKVCSSDGVCAMFFPEIRPKDTINYSLGLLWSF